MYSGIGMMEVLAVMGKSQFKSIIFVLADNACVGVQLAATSIP